MIAEPKMKLLEQQLARVDLNLLVSLSVLLKEQNVSRAAEKLYLSQSAMSRTLQRLRDLFDDPLFYRTSSGITPTEKALSLEAMLPDLLQKLDNIFHGDDFSPESCEKHIAVSMPSLISHAFFLPMIHKIAQQAPKLQFTEYPASANPFSALTSGEYDFSIHVEKPIDPNFKTIKLGKVAPAIFASKKHPLNKQDKVSLEDCIKYPFVDLNINAGAASGLIHPIDSILLNHGYRRNIQLKSSQFSLLTQVLKTSDCLLAGPNFLMNPKAYEDFECIYQFEANSANLVSLYLISHKRTETSPIHTWLEKQIVDFLTQYLAPVQSN